MYEKAYTQVKSTINNLRLNYELSQ